MVETSFGRNVARRDLLTGRWAPSDGDKGESTVEIASILVQTRPERLEAAARAIERLSGTQIYGRDPRGKLDDRFHESCHIAGIHLWFQAPICLAEA